MKFNKTILLIFVNLFFTISLFSQDSIYGFWEESSSKKTPFHYCFKFEDNQVYVTLKHLDTIREFSFGTWSLNTNSKLKIKLNHTYIQTFEGYYEYHKDSTLLSYNEIKFKRDKKIILNEIGKDKLVLKRSQNDKLTELYFEKENVNSIFSISEAYFFNKMTSNTIELHEKLLFSYTNLFFDCDDRRLFLLYILDKNTDEEIKKKERNALLENDFWLAYWCNRVLYLRTSSEEYFDKAMLYWNLNLIPIENRER